MLWGIDWQTVQRMLIDVVDTTQKKSGDDFDLDDDEVEINDDNIESIMKSLEKYK